MAFCVAGGWVGGRDAGGAHLSRLNEASVAWSRGAATLLPCVLGRQQQQKEVSAPALPPFLRQVHC